MARYRLFVFPLITVVMLFIGACTYLSAQEWAYLGQEPPGDTAQLFAPEIMQHKVHSCPTFTPDGTEIYWSSVCEPDELRRVKYMKYENDQWTGPFIAAFSGQFMDDQPFISHDGSRLIFASLRPAHIVDTGGLNLWTVQRTGNQWTEPEQIGPPIDTNQEEWTPSVAHDGTLCYMGYLPHAKQTCGVFICTQDNGQYNQPEPLPLPINHPSYQDWTPWISPNGDYILYASERRDQFGLQDIYIALKDLQGAWRGPYNLGAKVNTGTQERFPGLSQDGNYLFFTRWRNSSCYHDLYWIEARDLVPDPNGPVRNATLGQRFNTIGCAVRYAQSGDEIIIGPGQYHETIDFQNKNLIIRSVDPNTTTQTMIRGDSQHPVVTISGSTSRLAGLTISSGRRGIQGSEGTPTITGCHITENLTNGIDLSGECCASIQNCIIAGNGGVGIQALLEDRESETPSGKPEIINCTITENGLQGLLGEATITNSIIYHNYPDVNDSQVTPSTSTITYSCIQGGWEGLDNMDQDPCFASLGHRMDANDPNSAWICGDYHLLSQTGRWDPNRAKWIMDNTTSPCIDAGNADDPLGQESTPNGIIVNMGAYGGTPQASKTYTETLTEGQLRVTYIANEGFLLESQNKRVLIDALFNYDEDLYDFPSDTLREHITLGHGPFSPIDCYFVTHQHRDHFYAPYVALFLQHHPESIFVSAQQVVDLFDIDINDLQDQIVGLPLVLGETIEQTFNGIETRATRMRHVSDNTGNGAHNMVYLMNLDGIKVLHVGDTIIPWETARFNAMNLQQEDVNVVFLEAFDTYSVSKTFVNNVIKPDYVIGMHFRRDNQRTSEINTFRQAYLDGIIFEYPLQSQVLTTGINSSH